MTQLNLFKYFKGILVVTTSCFTMPWWPRRHAKCHQQLSVQRRQAAIAIAALTAIAKAALTANGSYAFAFLCWKANISFRTGNRHPFIRGSYSLKYE